MISTSFKGNMEGELLNCFLLLTFTNPLQEEFRKRRLTLDNALREEVQREAVLLTHVENDKEAKCELARRLDKQDQRQMYDIQFFSPTIESCHIKFLKLRI